MIHPHDIYSIEEPWTSRIKNIAEEFIKKGHEVRLVYFPLPVSERNNKLRIKRFKKLSSIPLSRNKWAIFKNLIKIYNLAKWADVVHFQKCFAHSTLPAIFGAYLNNKPLHYDWDDWEFKIYQASGPSKLVGSYLNLLETFIPEFVDTMSVASNKLRLLAIKRGVKPKNIFESHVCVNLKIFNPKNRQLIRKKYGLKGLLVIYQGQLQGAQYVDLFIHAAKIVNRKMHKVRFMVVGGGYNLPRLRGLANSLGLKENIIFTDFVLHEDVPYYISAADVAIACFEDNDLTRCKSPLKIVEYMACGKAIVATDVGEVKKMLGGCGVLVKPGDAESLARGIIRLLNNTKLRSIKGKKALKRAIKYYHWGVTADSLLNAYYRSISMHNRSRCFL